MSLPMSISSWSIMRITAFSAASALPGANENRLLDSRFHADAWFHHVVEKLDRRGAEVDHVRARGADLLRADAEHAREVLGNLPADLGEYFRDSVGGHHPGGPLRDVGRGAVAL